MAEATLSELKAHQTALQEKFKESQQAFFKAQKIHNASKAELSAFETKYGRAMALFTEVSDGPDT